MTNAWNSTSFPIYGDHVEPEGAIRQAAGGGKYPGRANDSPTLFPRQRLDRSSMRRISTLLHLDEHRSSILARYDVQFPAATAIISHDDRVSPRTKMPTRDALTGGSGTAPSSEFIR
jgi:hypothetical protein